MKNKCENIGQGLFVTERNRNSWERSGSKLFSNTNILTDITKECIESGNEVFFIKNFFSSVPLIFGTRLLKDKAISAKVIWGFNSLMENEVEPLLPLLKQDYFYNSFNNPAFLSNTNLSSITFVREHIESDFLDYEALIKSYTSAAEKHSYAYLYISKGHADFILFSNNADYYNLKEASKEIRKTFPDCKEYFYQNSEGKEILTQALSMEKITLQENDAHRVIFEK